MSNEIKEKNILDLSDNIINNPDLSNNIINNPDLSNNITCLCFSGGGIKGISFIGALERLIEKKLIYLNNINLFVGTSVGSMIAFLLCLDIDIQEIKDFVLTFNFSKLTGEIDCLNLFEQYGINNGERIKLIFIKFLEIKYNIKDATFEELYKLTNKKLIIIGTNISKSCEKIFSVDLTPTFSVINAIRISISIPIVFTPVTIDNDVFVDGALVNNFPINHCPENQTIGLYIKNSKECTVNSIQSLVIQCLSITSDTISEIYINKYKKNIIKIINPNYEFTKFDLSLDYKKSLLTLGHESINEYINLTNL